MMSAKIRGFRLIPLLVAIFCAVYGLWTLHLLQFPVLPWIKITYTLNGMAAQLASSSLLALATFIVLMLYDWKFGKLRLFFGYIAFFSFILAAVLSLFY